MKSRTKFEQRLILLLMSLYKGRFNEEKGYILVLIIGLALALNFMFIAYVMLSKVERVSTTASSDTNSGFYGAEAGLNLRAEALRLAFVDFSRPSGTSPTSVSACLDSDTSNDGSGNYNCQTTQLSSASKNKAAHFAATYIVEKNGGRPTTGVVPRGETYQNLNMIEYGYSVYSVAKKQNSPSSEVTAILQLDVKSRLIPMFQFASFYANDLEILPSPAMNLNGPVHTNGNLYLGSDNVLNINGQVTMSGNLFNKRKNNNATYPDGRVRIMNAAGTTLLNLLLNGTGSTSETANAMDPTRLSTAWGTQIQLGLESISLPPPSLLNSSGDYYIKADLRILYKPTATSTAAPNLTTVPFEITAINRSSSTSVSLTEGELRSLRQPVLVNSTLGSIASGNPDFRVCTPSTPTTITSLTTTQQQQLPELLYVAMVSQATPIAYSTLSTALTNTALSGVRTSLLSLINLKFSLSLSLLPTDILNLTPLQIAALDSRCFVGAPLQDIGRDNASHQSPYRFFNDRENRDMRLLQLNFQALAVWNSVGRYVQFNSGVVTNNNSSQGFSANQRLFLTAAANSNAPVGSFQNLGLAASDASEEGFVIHATINTTSYSSGNGNQSPYGFAITQGKQLISLAKNSSTTDPLGVTFATDQAVYIQGDYNSLNKQPAAILADSLNVLSNACLNADQAINKFTARNCDMTTTGGSKVNATATTINSAFLAGTDVTNSTATSGYSGGLENYPRFSETWSGQTLTYRGSFVSLGTPLHVGGNWTSQQYDAPGRNWDYDTGLNNPDNLPPLTPQFVYLKQESFVRNFQQ